MRAKSMTRRELSERVASSSKFYSYAWYSLICVVIGGTLAVPSVRDFSPRLADNIGDTWLVPFLVAWLIINLIYYQLVPRCPHCRKSLNVAVAFIDGYCVICRGMAVEDASLKGN